MGSAIQLKIGPTLAGAAGAVAFIRIVAWLMGGASEQEVEVIEGMLAKSAIEFEQAAVEFAVEEEAALLNGLDSIEHDMRVSRWSDETTFRDALSVAIGKPLENVALHDSDGIAVVISSDAMEEGGDYELKTKCSSEMQSEAIAAAKIAAAKLASQRAERASEDAKANIDPAYGDDTNNVAPTPDRREGAPKVEISPDQIVPRLQRVMIVSYGAGDNRRGAEKALASAYKHFKGDCIPSFHLLTDNVRGVDKLFNPTALTPRLERDHDQYFFEDVLSAVKDAAVKVDLLFYIDHRSRFVKDVLLIDIAADIVAVQHPVYPRDSWGFCNQMSEGPGTNTAGVHCEYPYERNKQSSASIPDEVGKFVQKGKNKWSNGKNQRFCVTTGWYLQGNFWGGRTKFLLPGLAEVAADIASDRLTGMPSDAIKSESYWNHWVYKHSPDKETNFRIL
eukprot:gene5382-13354_t